MRILLAAFTAAFGLVACGDASQPSPPATSASTAPAAATTPAPVKVDFADARPFSGPDTFSVLVPSAATKSAVEAAAREKCDGKDFCKVLGWTDPDLIARGFPMTDRELEGQVFAYSLNRQSGLDEAVWTCEGPEARCPT